MSCFPNWNSGHLYGGKSSIVWSSRNMDLIAGCWFLSDPHPFVACHDSLFSLDMPHPTRPLQFYFWFFNHLHACMCASEFVSLTICRKRLGSGDGWTLDHACVCPSKIFDHALQLIYVWMIEGHGSYLARYCHTISWNIYIYIPYIQSTQVFWSKTCIHGSIN